MIYILKRCVNWEGSEIITATSTISSLIEKIKKLVNDKRVNFGDYCEIDFYNGDGNLVGMLNIERSEIPGAKYPFGSKALSSYLEPTNKNYSKFYQKIQRKEHSIREEFAKAKIKLQ